VMIAGGAGGGGRRPVLLIHPRPYCSCCLFCWPSLGLPVNRWVGDVSVAVRVMHTCLDEARGMPPVRGQTGLRERVRTRNTTPVVIHARKISQKLKVAEVLTAKQRYTLFMSHLTAYSPTPASIPTHVPVKGRYHCCSC
jgi:hypothetical protein